MGPQEERELIKKAEARDRDATSRLLETWSALARLVIFKSKWGFRPHEPEEILAECRERFWSSIKLKRFAAVKDIRAYVCAIVINACRRRIHISNEAREVGTEVEPVDPRPGPAEEVMVAELCNRVLQMLGRWVDEECKRLVELYFWWELTEREIGKVLGNHESTVSRNLRKCLGQFSEWLHSEGIL